MPKRRRASVLPLLSGTVLQVSQLGVLCLLVDISCLTGMIQERRAKS